MLKMRTKSILIALAVMLVSVVCAILSMGAATTHSDAVTVKLSESTVLTTVQEVTLTLSVEHSGDNGVGAVQGNITYDSTMFSIGEDDFELKTTGWDSDSQIIVSAGNIKIMFSANNTKGDVKGNFDVAVLKFKKIGSPTDGSSYNFAFKENDDDFEVACASTTGVYTNATGSNGKITFRAPSSDASLKLITVRESSSSGNVLAGTWSNDNKTYTVTSKVAYTLANVYISAEKNETNATVSGTGVKNLTFNDNVATVSFTVTAEDGSKVDYSVIIERTPADTNTNATLSLSSSDASLTFESISLASGTTEYTVSAQVPYILRSGVVSAAATPVQSTSRVTGYQLNGASYTENAKMNLEVGDNTLTITVVSQGSPTPAATTVYTVKISVIAGNSDTAYEKIYISDDGGNELNWDSGLSITLTTSQISGLTLHAAAQTSSSKVYIDGVETTSKSLTLSVGNNSFVVKIEAEDGQYEEYTVTVTVMSAGTSNDYSVDFKFYAGGVQCSLRNFNNTYYAQFYDNVTSLRVTVTTSDSADDVFIGVYAGNALKGLADSGDNIAYSSDITEIKVQIQRSSGEMLTYTIALVAMSSSATENYISVGGDIQAFISQSDFLSENKNVINETVKVKYKQSDITFSLELPDTITVEVVYGAVQISGNGSTSAFGVQAFSTGTNEITLRAESLSTGGNTIVLRLEDSSAGISKLYVLNVVRAESGAKSAYLALFIVFLILFVAAACATVVFVIKYFRKKKFGPVE